MTEALANPPAYFNQNTIVVYVGENGGYFVGRQTPEHAADTVSYFEQPEWIARHGEASRLHIIDCSDDPDLTQTVLEDTRAALSREAIEASKY